MVFVVCRATVAHDGGNNVMYFKSRKGIYTSGVATATGVAEADEKEQDAPCIKVEELLKSGALYRLNAYGKDGSKNKRSQLLVTRAKLATAPDDLLKKVINGFTVKKVIFPRRASYY